MYICLIRLKTWLKRSDQPSVLIPNNNEDEPDDPDDPDNDGNKIC